MQKLYKTLLASSLVLLATTYSSAEQPTMGPQGPIWGSASGPVPITWGDCIPVPIAPMPMQGMQGMPMQGMPMGGFGNDQQGAMAPPSPFFGNMPSAMIPMPSPVAPPPLMYGNNPAPLSPAPLLPSQVPPQVNLTCDDGSQKQLHSLQNRYNQASAASKAKIEEITLAMQDAQNQMADARVIIEELSKQQVADQSKITELQKLSGQVAAKSHESNESLSVIADELAQLKQKNQAILKENEGLKNTFSKMDNAYRFMESKLAKLTSQQTMGAVTNINNDQSKNIIKALKDKITSLENNNKTFQSQLMTAQKKAGSQARKLTALGQSATELSALKSAYKSRNNENEALKTELAKLKSDHTATTLNNAQSKNIIATLRAKVEDLGKTNEMLEKDLSGLKSDYSATAINSAQSKNIIEALKAKVVSLGNNNKTLQSQLGTLTIDAGSQARKITALSRSSTELTALQSAYKSKTADNEALMAKLVELNNRNKTLQSQLTTFQAEMGSQARKLTALGQSATELTALQSAYKERNNENAELKAKLAKLKALSASSVLKQANNKNIIDDLNKKLATSEASRKTCLSKTATLESTSANQARKITALTSKTAECVALKSAYDELNSKKSALSSKLTEVTADDDGDGVLNPQDKCPASPVGSAVNKEGCPDIKDADSDGIADANDLCANTATGSKVNEFGCTATENITLKGVTFNTGSATLKTSSYSILDAAAETLAKAPNLKVEISGHTDFQGSAAVNKRLSQRRANSVMIYLIRKGVNAANLSATGYGEENPIATNDTAQGRATNRRVELKIK